MTAKKAKTPRVLWVIVNAEGWWNWMYYNRKNARAACAALNQSQGASCSSRVYKYILVERKK